MVIFEEVKQFIDELERPTIAKLWRMIGLLDNYRHRLTMPYSKMVDRNLYELRVKGKQEVRIMYTFKDDDIILFYGFIKKSQKIPGQQLRTIYQKFLYVHS